MTTNFKAYVLDNPEIETTSISAKKKTEYIWTPELLGGPDFVIHRSTVANPNKKVSAVFLISLPTPQLYIKEAGSTKPMDANSLKIFLRVLKEPLSLKVGEEMPIWIDSFPCNAEEAVTLLGYLQNPEIRNICKTGLVMYSSTREDYRTPKWINATYKYKDVDFWSKFNTYTSIIERHLTEDQRIKFKKCLWESLIDPHGYISYNTEARKKWGGLANFVSSTNYTEFINFVKLYGGSGLVSLVETYAQSPCLGFQWGGLSTLLNQTTFQLSSLIEYMFLSSYEQGYGDKIHNFCVEWRECLEMQKQIYGKVQEKYPEYLASENVRLRFKANVLRELLKKEEFEKRAPILKSHEWENDKMKIVAPETVQDIVDEGQHQANCVGSYVQTVIDGKCEIYFLRKKNSLTKSYVTVEVRNGKIAQAKAKYNKEPDAEAWRALREFEKAYNKIN